MTKVFDVVWLKRSDYGVALSRHQTGRVAVASRDRESQGGGMGIKH
jgi:hypothetical protein